MRVETMLTQAIQDQPKVVSVLCGVLGKNDNVVEIDDHKLAQTCSAGTCYETLRELM